MICLEETEKNIHQREYKIDAKEFSEKLGIKGDMVRLQILPQKPNEPFPTPTNSIGSVTVVTQTVDEKKV